MSTHGTPTLSILIATKDRPESLRETLVHLAGCASVESHEVVVIDNGSEALVTPAVLDVPGLGRTRLLRESQPGKWRALNRGLEAGDLGEIVAVIDDDMSPESHWIEGVLATVRRLPEFDLFSGRSYVVWPPGVEPPPWARDALAGGLLFSVLDLHSPSDREFGLDAPRFPSGNHFWFRRSVLEEGVRFPALWTTENHFVAALGARGHRGMFVSDVAIGHRILPQLVDAKLFLVRAERFGREMAHLETWVQPPRTREKASWIRRSKRRAHAFATLVGWSLFWLCAGFAGEDWRLPARARALWGIGFSRERLNPTWQNTAEVRSDGVFGASPNPSAADSRRNSGDST